MLSGAEAVYVAIAVCIFATIAVGALLRRAGASLGLPFAYCCLVMLQHLPGAWAAAAGGQSRARLNFVQTGLDITAVAFVCFAVGVWLVDVRIANSPSRTTRTELLSAMRSVPGRFIGLCLVGGWTLSFFAQTFINLPSVNALIEKGAAIWLLAVIIGVSATAKRNHSRFLLWLVVLLAYPLFVLVVGGFMSWGTASIVIVLSVFCLAARRYGAFLAGCVVTAVVGMSLFVAYFEIRDDLRAAAWGGAPISQRAAQASRMADGLSFVSSDNPTAMKALDKRLNQNYFIGLAADRLQRGQVDFLWGRSLWEGVIALVPRAIWPNKPVFGGSGDIVRDMTGLNLERHNTAWGVGSVMEFYVNFGIVGVVFGFVLFGFTLTYLDRRAARGLVCGNYNDVIMFFLPGVALIQPLGSLVELVGGAAAALTSALIWRWIWLRMSASRTLLFRGDQRSIKGANFHERLEDASLLRPALSANDPTA